MKELEEQSILYSRMGSYPRKELSKPLYWDTTTVTMDYRLKSASLRPSRAKEKYMCNEIPLGSDQALFFSLSLSMLLCENSYESSALVISIIFQCFSLIKYVSSNASF
jgi:hypothetical protein